MSALEVKIRNATEADIDSVCCIYEQNVLLGTGSFEIVPPTDEQMLQRYRRVISWGCPYLVAESCDEVVGFAYASLYKERAAYFNTVEDSVYVHPEVVGNGVGTQLLTALIAECEFRGFRQMVARIGDSENFRSIALHKKCGFYEVGTLHAVGLKFDRWLDSVIMQRALGPGDTEPPQRKENC